MDIQEAVYYSIAKTLEKKITNTNTVLKLLPFATEQTINNLIEKLKQDEKSYMKGLTGNGNS